MLLRPKAPDYAEILVALSRGIKHYRKAVLAKKVEEAKDIAYEMEKLAEKLVAATNMSEKCSCLMDDVFHKNFKDAVFMDDKPLHIWRESWIMATEACVSIVKRRAGMFQAASDTKVAMDIESLIPSMRGTYEDNQQVRASADDSKRAEPSDIF
jgi:hypothetical protein